MNFKTLLMLLCAIIISVNAKKKREPAKGSRKSTNLHDASFYPLDNNDGVH